MKIPEAGLRVRPTEWYLALQPAQRFRIARPEAFADPAHFHHVAMRFSVRARPGRVFDDYRAINPLKIWSTARSWLVAVHVPSLRRTLDRTALASRWPGFERGMKVFLDMSALPVAITNRPAMMVGLEITRMDRARRIVEYRYLEGTPSYGRQVMTFRASPHDRGATEILHETWYRSYSRVIEAMYPYYHREMLCGMHEGFRREIEAVR